MADTLEIPKFLDRTGGRSLKQILASRAATGDYEDSRYKFAPDNPDRDRSLWLKPKGMSMEEFAASRAQRAADQAARKSASFAKFKDKLAAKTSVPTDLKGRPLYSMPDCNVTATGVVVGGGKRSKPQFQPKYDAGPAQSTRGRSGASADDIGDKVSKTCGADRDKLKKFAVSNGVWKDGDQNAKNNGLLRMTIVNRLRGKLRREPEYKVVWS